MSEISPQNSSPMAGLLPRAQYAWLIIDGSTISVSGSLSSYNVGLECQGLLWSQPEVEFVKEMNVNQFLELKVFHS